METSQQILTELPTETLKTLQREVDKMEMSEGWGLLVKYMDSEIVHYVARLATPAEGVDSLVRKEYYNGAIAAALKVQGAPEALKRVIGDELDSRPTDNDSEDEDDG